MRDHHEVIQRPADAAHDTEVALDTAATVDLVRSRWPGLAGG